MIRTFFIAFILLFLSACESYNTIEDSVPSVEGDIVDSDAWYSDNFDVVTDINITIPVPNEYLCSPYNNLEAPPRPCTLEDVYNDTDANDEYKPKLHVYFSAKDYENINNLPNAEFYQKGKSTRNSKLKSYRIKLDEDANLFHNERSIQLNKHPNDHSRVRNRLAFEFFEEIPNFTSLKTKFCRLNVDGKDYGLFTHVENGDKYFLQNRGWSEEDYLYKAQNFAFTIDEGMEIDLKGKPLDKKAFEAVIEPQTGKDFTKLIDMINAINETQTDEEFEKVFNRYFNRSNYITWMAINLIMANKDTVSQNFFLYNPKGSDTFYFTPWDYDGTASDTDEYAKWELGISTWWGIPLHQKFLAVKKNRDDVDTMVTNLRENYITPEKIEEKLKRYKILVEPFMQRSPDIDILSYARWEKDFKSLVSRLDVNIKNYRDQFGSPMPFWQNYKYVDGILTLSWDEAVDFEGDEIVYDLLCADNPDMNNTIIDRKGLSSKNGELNVSLWGSLSYSLNIDLKSGDHLFMKVIAKEKDNPLHYQISFDNEVKVNDVYYFGELEFKVE